MLKVQREREEENERKHGGERSGEKKGNGKWKKEKRIRQSAFAFERPPRGRDRRQKHRRLTSARNHSRADPGKIRPPIVYIEIRSCRNAPRGTISASGHPGTGDGGKGIRDVCRSRGIRKRSRERSIRFFSLAKFFAFVLLATKVDENDPLFQDRILEHRHHHVECKMRSLYLTTEMYLNREQRCMK